MVMREMGSFAFATLDFFLLLSFCFESSVADFVGIWSNSRMVRAWTARFRSSPIPSSDAISCNAAASLTNLSSEER